jgi:rhamnulokinase
VAATGSDAFVAVDLGASSGRVMLGRVGADVLELTEVRRFANEPVRLPSGAGDCGSLHWDVLRLWHEIVEGLRDSARSSSVPVSIGVDSWAVDYGLLDAGGRLLGNPHHYRDARTETSVGVVHARAPFEELYSLNGLQPLALTTIYQLAAERWATGAGAASTMLLVPDLVAYWLGAPPGTELTNASTTGLLDVHTG